MKLHLSLILLLGTTLAAVVCATLLARPKVATSTEKSAPCQTFEVKGQVRSVEPDGLTVRIAHEEIPGYMPAMEMPFTVKDPGLLRAVASGDTVKFQLLVTKEDSWITRLDKVADAAVATSPPVASASEPPRVETGQPVPDFTLINQNGQAFRFSEFRGKAVVLTFIYTRCPLPNFCPLMSKNFSALQERFARDLAGKVQLLSISFDPDFDTPPVLKRYAEAFEKEGKNWTFATGTAGQVDYVTSLFGLYREAANGLINHDLRTALIGPDGRLVHVWRSNVWTPYEVERMVRQQLQPELAATTAARHP
jgi:protein SCO1/2